MTLAGKELKGKTVSDVDKAGLPANVEMVSLVIVAAIFFDGGWKK